MVLNDKAILHAQNIINIAVVQRNAMFLFDDAGGVNIDAIPLFGGEFGISVLYHAGQNFALWYNYLKAFNPPNNRNDINSAPNTQPEKRQRIIGGRVANNSFPFSSQIRNAASVVHDNQVKTDLPIILNMDYKIDMFSKYYMDNLDYKPEQKDEVSNTKSNTMKHIYIEKGVRDLPETLVNVHWSSFVNNGTIQVDIANIEMSTSAYNSIVDYFYDVTKISKDEDAEEFKGKYCMEKYYPLHPLQKTKGGKSKQSKHSSKGANKMYIKMNKTTINLGDIRGKYRFTDKKRTHIIYNGHVRKVYTIKS